MKRTPFAKLVDEGLMKVGDGYRAKNSELGGDGLVFLRSAYLQDSGFQLNDPDRFQISEPDKFGDKVACHGDSVITTKGNSTGRVGYVNGSVEGAVYSPHLSYWRSMNHQKIEPRFLYYWSRSAEFLDQLGGMAFSTDMAPYLSLRDQLRLEIALPEIGIQQGIAATLGALDDKIELNRRMSATLEGMARALYRSWFVDFDPVHARALGQPPVHMDPATAALFPDSFGSDGLPKGWEWRSLDDFATFLNGAALQKFPAENGADSLPVIKIAELRSGITPKSNRAGLQVPEKYKISNGDVLFSWSGSLLQKVWTEGPGALNQHLFKVTSNTVPKWFHFFAVGQHMEEFRQIAASKATTMGHIQRHHLKEALVALPGDEAVIAAAEKAIGPAFDRGIAADLENQTLAALRDTLLPRLMSGELHIREAEKQVEEAV